MSRCCSVWKARAREALPPRRNGGGSYSHAAPLRSLNLEFNSLTMFEGVSCSQGARAGWSPSREW